MKERIYIIEFCPHGSDMRYQAQMTRPIHDLMTCALQYRNGIEGVSIRPLMTNGHFMAYNKGKRVMI